MQRPADRDGIVTGPDQAGRSRVRGGRRETGPFAGEPAELAGVFVERRFHGVRGRAPRIGHAAQFGRCQRLVGQIPDLLMSVGIENLAIGHVGRIGGGGRGGRGAPGGGGGGPWEAGAGRPRGGRARGARACPWCVTVCPLVRAVRAHRVDAGPGDVNTAVPLRNWL